MSLAQQYDQWHTGVFESDSEHLDESSPWYVLLLEHLEPIEGKRVLEIACGRGGFSRVLASRGAEVTGADFSNAAIRIANQKLQPHAELSGRVTYVQADAQSLPFPDNSYDLVISCETIEHVPDPRAALREMHRVCRVGGKLYLTTPNYLNCMGLYEIYATVRHPGHKSTQPLDNRYVCTQVRQFVHQAGWKIIRSDGTVHQFPVIPRRNPVLVPSLEANRTIRRLLSPFAFHYFVIASRAE